MPLTLCVAGLITWSCCQAYDVEYVVRDIESLVFWLNALDPAHADVDGRSALASAAILNQVLAGNVDERGRDERAPVPGHRARHRRG